MSDPQWDKIDLFVNGRPVSVPAGNTVLSAVAKAGFGTTHTSVTGQPRGPLCGMGFCHECTLTINGLTHQRSCMVAASAGMLVETGPLP